MEQTRKHTPGPWRWTNYGKRVDWRYTKRTDYNSEEERRALQDAIYERARAAIALAEGVGKGLTDEDGRPGVVLPAETCPDCDGSGRAPAPEGDSR